VQLDVSLAGGLSIQQLPPSAALFILARAPGGGPPLAVIRKPPSAVPGQFTLSDANSMIPGRSLSDFEEVTLIARLSKTGQPQEQPGDWYAQTSYRPKEGKGTVALVIDQVVQ
jgi:cytochrome c-type biogenesis protein CcmH